MDDRWYQAHPIWMDDDPIYEGPVEWREVILEGVTFGAVLFAIACALFGLAPRVMP